MERLIGLVAVMVGFVVVFQLYFRKREQLEQARFNENLSGKARRTHHKPDMAQLNLVNLDLEIELD
jgi:hypothetical protein